jgi:hypothetical protein
MKFILLSILAFTCSIQSRAATSVFSEPNDSSTYNQLFSISAGPYQPESVVVNNGNYSFDYGSATQSFLVEAGWSARLFWAAGAFYLNENILYSQFTGATHSLGSAPGSDTSLTLNLLGLDTRLSYALEWFPIHWFIPFAEAGYQFSFYSQGGSTDLNSVQGSVGNAVAGAGARVWLNRGASESDDSINRHSAMPIFLLFKWNRIVPNTSNGLNLADSSFLGGLSVGL